MPTKPRLHRITQKRINDGYYIMRGQLCPGPTGDRRPIDIYSDRNGRYLGSIRVDDAQLLTEKQRDEYRRTGRRDIALTWIPRTALRRISVQGARAPQNYPGRSPRLDAVMGRAATVS